MTDNNKSGVFVVGMIVGSLVGAATGLLVAPRSGQETRKILRKSAEALPEMAEDVSATVQIQTDRLSASALKNWHETLTRLKEAIATGVEVSQQQAQHLQSSNDRISEGQESDLS